MKKYLIFAITTTIIVVNAFSQNLELRFSGGYGFSKGATPMTDYDRTFTSSTISYSNVKDKYTSIGQGTRFEGGFIYYLKEQFGFFVQAGYSHGSETAKTTNKGSSYDTWANQTSSFNCISTMVGLHFHLTDGTLKPYGGVGAGIIFLNDLTKENNEKTLASLYEKEEIFSANNPIGYCGYLGLNFNLSSSISLFVEGKATLVSFYITKIETTKYLVDGQDKLGTLSVRDRVTIFEENKDYTMITTGDENQPTQGSAPLPAAANSIAILMGVSIRF